MLAVATTGKCCPPPQLTLELRADHQFHLARRAVDVTNVVVRYRTTGVCDAIRAKIDVVIGIAVPIENVQDVESCIYGRIAGDVEVLGELEIQRSLTKEILRSARGRQIVSAVWIDDAEVGKVVLWDWGGQRQLACHHEAPGKPDRSGRH